MTAFPNNVTGQVLLAEDFLAECGRPTELWTAVRDWLHERSIDSESVTDGVCDLVDMFARVDGSR